MGELANDLESGQVPNPISSTQDVQVDHDAVQESTIANNSGLNTYWAGLSSNLCLRIYPFRDIKNTISPAKSNQEDIAKKKCFDYIDNPIPGEHLSSDPDYRRTIVNLQKRNKNLVHSDWKIPKSRQGKELPGRIRILTFNGTKPEPEISADINDPEGLLTILETNAESRRIGNENIFSENVYRVHLLEGTTPKLAGVLGEHFDIDPAIFVRHQRTGLWEGRHKAGNTPELASNEDRTQNFMMEYGGLLFFPDGVQGPSYRNPNDNRHISTSKKPHKNVADIDNVGILHRKASFWSKTYQNGGWDVVLITDPALPKIPETKPSKYKFLVGPQKKAVIEEIRSELYQGGYRDFIKFSDLSKTSMADGPARESMLGDLCFYWKQHGKHVVLEKDPRLATVFLQKIIASNYLILIEFLKSLLNELEFSIVRTEIHVGRNQARDVAEKWSVLQSWSHRFPEYGEMVHDILDIYCEKPKMLSNSADVKERNTQSDAWTKCHVDFEAIDQKFNMLRRRTEKLSDSFIGLASMAGTQESLDEAKNVKILTFLGIFFLPLSLIASIFAMADPYGPGKPKFHTYFSIAFPISGGLVVCSMLVLFGWHIEFWRSLSGRFQTRKTRNK